MRIGAHRAVMGIEEGTVKGCARCGADRAGITSRVIVAVLRDIIPVRKHGKRRVINIRERIAGTILRSGRHSQPMQSRLEGPVVDCKIGGLPPPPSSLW